MKTLWQWMVSDWSAWFLVSLCVVFAVIPDVPGVIGLVIAGSVICYRILKWSRTLPCLLCAALLAQSVDASERPAPELQGAGVAIGIVVAIIGGVATYKLVRICQKWAGKSNVVDRIEKADSASIYHGNGSCLADSAKENVVELRFDGNHLTISSMQAVELDRSSLQLGTHFYQSGDEIEPEVSRIHFGSRSVYVDPVDHAWIIERSYDLQSWEPVLSIYQPDMQWSLEDSFESREMFYRVTQSYQIPAYN